MRRPTWSPQQAIHDRITRGSAYDVPSIPAGADPARRYPALSALFRHNRGAGKGIRRPLYQERRSSAPLASGGEHLSTSWPAMPPGGPVTYANPRATGDPNGFSMEQMLQVIRMLPSYRGNTGPPSPMEAQQVAIAMAMDAHARGVFCGGPCTAQHPCAVGEIDDIASLMAPPQMLAPANAHLVPATTQAVPVVAPAPVTTAPAVGLAQVATTPNVSAPTAAAAPAVVPAATVNTATARTGVPASALRAITLEHYTGFGDEAFETWFEKFEAYARAHGVVEDEARAELLRLSLSGGAFDWATRHKDDSYETLVANLRDEYGGGTRTTKAMGFPKLNQSPDENICDFHSAVNASGLEGLSGG